MKKRLFCLALILICICICSVGMAELRVWFLDVGQGDAIVLSCDEQVILVDAGTIDAGPSVNRFLREDLGINKLNAVIATHNHDDHIGGMPAALTGLMTDIVFSSPSVSVFYWFDNVMPNLLQDSLNVQAPVQGDTFQLGEAVLTFLSRDDPSLNPNNRSLVIRVDYGNTSLLLTGDAESDEETQLLETDCNIKADVLKIAHHGGLGSTGSNFLTAVSPEYAIISVGTGNDFGHPADETLRLLGDSDIQVYRTDLYGTVICTSDGENITIEITKASVN